MAHFYGGVTAFKGADGLDVSETHRLSGKNGGVDVVAATDSGCVRVCLRHEDGKDIFKVMLGPWRNGRGISETIAEGIIGEPTKGGA